MQVFSYCRAINHFSHNDKLDKKLLDIHGISSNSLDQYIPQLTRLFQITCKVSDFSIHYESFLILFNASLLL